MPARLTATEAVEKHAKRLKAASDEIRRGVQAVTEAPSQKAVEKQDKMRENLIAAIDDGRWANALSKYSLQDWKNDMLNKGIGRIGKGIDEAQGKMRRFFEWLLPKVYALSDEVKQMRDMTIDDAVARAERVIRGMAENKYKSQV